MLRKSDASKNDKKNINLRKSGLFGPVRTKGFKIVRLMRSIRVHRNKGTDCCGKACKDDPLGGKSASSLTHLVWLQKLLFVVQR